VRTKFVPKQKRLNRGYLFFDNKKPSKEGVCLTLLVIDTDNFFSFDPMLFHNKVFNPFMMVFAFSFNNLALLL
jgi:hypothetical protein